MCGATSEQKTLEASQARFYDTMTSSYNQVFGKQQGILDALTKVYQPIFDKGPSQRGYSDEESTSLHTNATESIAQNYANAKKSLNEELAARGGSDFLPTGSDVEINGMLDATAANQKASLDNKIETADWETGRENFQAAAAGLGATAAQENPVGFSNAATGSGEAASKTANDIAQADNSVWGSVVGALGGVAGAAVGGWAGKSK